MRDVSNRQPSFRSLAILGGLAIFASDAFHGARAEAPPAPVGWFRVYTRAVHGTANPHNEVASSLVEWDSLKLRMSADGAIFSQSIKPDFSKEIVLFVSLGAKGSSGYQLSLTELRELQEEVMIFLTETKPGGPRCGELSVISNPVLVAVIPKTQKPLHFSIEEVRKESCL